MKMSRSIKDYKDAMDNVKISDSFYKRTEVLLKESSEMEVTKGGSPKIRIVSRTIMAAAACLLVAFGVKTVIDSRTTDSSVVTEMITQETTVVTVPVTVPESASPVIDRPEKEVFVNDSGVQVGTMPEIPENDVDDDDTNTPENGTDTSLDGGEFTTEKTSTTAENVSEDDTDTDMDDVTEEVVEEAAPTASVETTVTTAKEGYPEMAEPKGVENIPPLSEAAVDTVNVEITPYFDMGADFDSNAIRSGENPVTKKGSEFSEVISAIASVTSIRPAEENEAFTTVFLIQLSEAETGLNYYTIYVTHASTLVVTRHDIDNQRRFICELSETEYDKILRLLYTSFGTPNEYEYFRSAKVGY